MKKCPFCAEEIQDEAIVCRYCGRDIKAKTWSYRTYILHFRSPDKKLSEEGNNETWNYWINTNTKKWERMEQDLTTKK